MILELRAEHHGSPKKARTFCRRRRGGPGRGQERTVSENAQGPGVHFYVSGQGHVVAGEDYRGRLEQAREVLFSKYHLATAQKFDLCFRKLILASNGTGLWEKETAMINCSVNIKKQLSLF